MKRVLAIVGIVLIILLPLVFVVYLNWSTIQKTFIKAKFLSRTSVSSQYAVETKTPEYGIAMTDTAFLEYIAATTHVYDDDAIADPKMYFGQPSSTIRHTVSHLKFELVPTLTQYVVGLGGANDFAGRGTYAVEGDVLVIRVSLNKEELVKGSGNVKFNMEDMFLDTALQTLVFATAKSGAPLSPFELNKIQQALKENIPTGIFPRPVKIETRE